jgi:4-hydroxy-3-methylbut-2-enyl diphosphate reductase
MLFKECQSVNPRAHLIESEQDIDPAWLAVPSVGISGATSTPTWLMERIFCFVSDAAAR